MKMSLFKKDNYEDFFGPQLEKIDIEKRYDIYAPLEGSRVCIYRNIKFIKKMALPCDGPSLGNDYWQVEQSDGKKMLVHLTCAICICETGDKPKIEIRDINEI